MAGTAEINSYLNNHYEGMSPEQLILALYKTALKNLELAKAGIEEKNIQKRGEHLSKTIAIVAELNASVDSTMTDESTQFLRGLYASILAELPKVSLTNDIKILTQTIPIFPNSKRSGKIRLWDKRANLSSGKTWQANIRAMRQRAVSEPFQSEIHMRRGKK